MKNGVAFEIHEYEQNTTIKIYPTADGIEIFIEDYDGAIGINMDRKHAALLASIVTAFSTPEPEPLYELDDEPCGCMADFDTDADIADIADSEGVDDFDDDDDDEDDDVDEDDFEDGEDDDDEAEAETYWLNAAYGGLFDGESEYRGYEVTHEPWENALDA